MGQFQLKVIGRISQVNKRKTIEIKALGNIEIQCRFIEWNRNIRSNTRIMEWISLVMALSEIMNHDIHYNGGENRQVVSCYRM